MGLPEFFLADRDRIGLVRSDFKGDEVGAEVFFVFVKRVFYLQSASKGIFFFRNASFNCMPEGKMQRVPNIFSSRIADMTVLNGTDGSVKPAMEYFGCWVL
jgi:hypothetical protein